MELMITSQRVMFQTNSTTLWPSPGKFFGIAEPIYAYRLIKWTLTNSVDPDQTPQNAVSDQGLHCLHLILEFSIKHGNNSRKKNN